MESINPATGAHLGHFAPWDAAKLESALAATARITPAWAGMAIAGRTAIVRAAAKVLRAQMDPLAQLITAEMGKPLKDARGEIEKCAWACDFYAEQAPAWLADEVVETDAGRSLVAYQPLGTVLAIMPWNFPFWQVFRFAAPALMAGNTGVLKHAANVTQCGLAIERVWHEAGAPPGVFQTLMLESAQVAGVIADPRVHAVTLTGSEGAGRKVAAAAGAALKKSVLELGGSDAFVVLADADLELAATTGVLARTLNAGQSCIAAKRFIVVPEIAERFLELFVAKAHALRVGDPLAPATDIGPLARADLRDQLHAQVQASVAAGAVLRLGGEMPSGAGNFYPVTVLDRVTSGMPAYAEELFGPVAIFIRALDEADALRIANDHRYGLGASVWTRDNTRGEAFARACESGAAFVNGMVKSDPRLPFGGVKASGYGRELSHHGLREFVNVKTVWIR